MKCNNVKISSADYTAPYSMPVILVMTDYFAILVAQFIAVYVRQHFSVFSVYHYMLDIPVLYFYFLVPAVFLAFLYNSHAYVNRIPFWDVIQKVFHAVILSMLVCITMMYFGHIAGGVSRIYVALLGLISFPLLCMFRYTLKKILYKLNILLEPVLIIGAGKTAELIVREIDSDTGLGFKVVGFIDDSPASVELPHKYPILGGFYNAENIIRKMKIKTVIIAAPGLDKKQLLKLIGRVQPLVKNLSFVPDLIGIPVANMEIQRFYNAKLMMLRVKNNMSRWHNRMIKIAFERTLGYLVFIGCIPILALIAISIKIDSKGSVFFNAKRIGRNNIEFTCYKFRTMYNNSDEILNNYLKDRPCAAEEWKIYRKMRGHDPRVTKVGRWLRKYSLDELPQIINVIKGNMGLVGPRPYLPEERDQMGDYISIIVKSLPGITGLWQVSGRNEISFSDRLKMDVWYIQNWSVWIDIVLLYKTIFTVLNRKGAY